MEKIRTHSRLLEWSIHTTKTLRITPCYVLFSLKPSFSPNGFLFRPPLSLAAGQSVAVIPKVWICYFLISLKMYNFTRKENWRRLLTDCCKQSSNGENARSVQAFFRPHQKLQHLFSFCFECSRSSSLEETETEKEEESLWSRSVSPQLGNWISNGEESLAWSLISDHQDQSIQGFPFPP